MSNALLVVDVQQFYLPDLPTDFAQKIANHYASLSYDNVAFVSFKNSPESPAWQTLKWTKCDTDEDAALPPEFKEIARAENSFTRGTYSAFQGTGLHEYLQKCDVNRLVICGVDTHACVLASAFEAFDLGYHVKVEFSLCHSAKDLHTAAEDIIRESIESRD